MKEQQDTGNELSRAVVYLRFVAGDRSGTRSAAARHLCERRANELGAVIVADYSDIGSGLTDDRKQLRRMLADLVTSADIDYVIVPDHATVALDMHIYTRITWRIQQAEVKLVVASSPLEQYREISASPLGLMQTVAEWANEDAQSKSRLRRIRGRMPRVVDPIEKDGESNDDQTDKEVTID
jgi:DNA invertase Pin-like site-specific DNA recombinase